MVMAANTIDDVKLGENARANLEIIKMRIKEEKMKRQEVERELRQVLAQNSGAYRPGEGDLLILGSGSKEFNLRSSNL
jgi:hypothetical protein